MYVPTMKMFDMGWYNHPVLHVALHGTIIHFYLGELLFSQTLCAVDLILKWKSVIWQSCWHVKCMCTPTYIHISHTHTKPNGNIYKYIPCAFKGIYNQHLFYTFLL